MTKLACSAFNCVNNVDAICTAAVIDINGENVNSKEGTECETFAPRTLGNAVKNVFNSNYLEGAYRIDVKFYSGKFYSFDLEGFKNWLSQNSKPVKKDEL